MTVKTHYLATGLTALLTLMLFVLGLRMLLLPKIALFSHWPYYLLPKGPLLLCLALATAWFRHHVTRTLMWLGLRLHRWLSALSLLLALGADGLLHVLYIPHAEGWWIPLVGGGAAASALGAWFKKEKKAPPAQEVEHG